ncbi:unnamed protein product, partial [Prorocentrum cordatum]
MDSAGILRRIAAVGSILESTVDQLQLAAVSRSQSGQLIRELKKARLPPEGLQPILGAIAESRLLEPDKASINTAISQLVSADGDHCMAIANYQEWEALTEFLPQPVWDSLPSGDPNILFDFLIDLGLRKTSEPTRHVMACLLMQAGRGLEGALHIDKDTRAESVLAVGTLLAQRAAQKPLPVPFSMKLPTAPVILQTEHPALYMRVYTLQPPKRFDLDPAQWNVLKKATKIRHRAGRAAVMGAPASSGAQWVPSTQ